MQELYHHLSFKGRDGEKNDVVFSLSILYQCFYLMLFNLLFIVTLGTWKLPVLQNEKLIFQINCIGYIVSLRKQQTFLGKMNAHNLRLCQSRE